MKKIFSLLIVLVFLCFTLNFNYVLANDNISTVGDNAANYYVEEVIEEVELDFGILYHNDSAFLNSGSAEFVQPDGYAAGSEKYGNEEFVIGKYYSANVNILEIPRSEDIEIIPYANIKSGKWSLATVAALISNFENTHTGKKVIAAINGDFFDINAEANFPYTSTGGTVSQGNYYKVNAGANSIGFKNDGSIDPMIGNLKPTVSSKPYVQIIENDTVVFEVEVDVINDIPGVGETSCYFPFYDELHNPIPVELNSAYFVKCNELVPYSKDSVYGYGEVFEIGSGNVDFNEYAIHTNNTMLKDYLEIGATVRVQYKYVGEFEGVDNVIGCGQTLIYDNNPVLARDYRHPRTMVGAREDGTIIMATIDGRQIEKGYYGASPVEQSALMQYYGCKEAYNLDGGGSTTIIIKQNGKFVVKNSPSDGSERSDGNCLLICADVPILELNALNIETDSFDIKIDIIKMIDDYQELYIEVNNEKKKVSEEIMHFGDLETYKEYVYKFYFYKDGKYIGLPISGVINTAKPMFEVYDCYLQKIEMDGKLYYKFSFNISDEYKTVIVSGIRINGKKIAVKNNEALFLVEDGCPISELYFDIGYDLSNGLGRLTYLSKDFELVFEDSELLINSIFESIDVRFDEIIK